MPERTPVAAVVVDVDHIADDEFVHQPLGREETGLPGERPIDHQLPPRMAHRLGHRVRFRQAAGEGFLHQQMDVERGDLCDPFAVFRGGGAEDHEIGRSLFQTGAVVGEDAVRAEAEVLRRLLHPGRLFVADADDLHVRMLESLPKQIAHVEVVEVNTRDAPAFHVGRAPGVTERGPVGKRRPRGMVRSSGGNEALEDQRDDEQQHEDQHHRPRDDAAQRQQIGQDDASQQA